MKPQSHNSTEDLLRDIFELCNRGLFIWLESQPDRWATLLELGKKVNHIHLEDEEGTKKVLVIYKSFLNEMTQIYESGGQMDMFTVATPELYGPDHKREKGRNRT
jgi:hypothetical protein